MFGSSLERVLNRHRQVVFTSTRAERFERRLKSSEGCKAIQEDCLVGAQKREGIRALLRVYANTDR